MSVVILYTSLGIFTFFVGEIDTDRANCAYFLESDEGNVYIFAVSPKKSLFSGENI